MKNLIVTLALFLTSVNAFAAYTCNVSLYSKSNLNKALNSIALYEQDATSSFGSIGTDSFYTETSRSELGFTRFTSGWVGKEEARFQFYRKVKSRGAPSESVALAKIELQGEKIQIVDFDAYRAFISCSTLSVQNLNENH